MGELIYRRDRRAGRNRITPTVIKRAVRPVVPPESWISGEKLL